MKQYLLFRLLITILGFLLVAFYIACLPPATRAAVEAYLYLLLGAYFAVGLTFLLSYPRWRHHPAFCRQQVLVDFVFQGLLIWSTGGVVSVFCPILFVTLAAATGVASARGAFVMATAATFFLGGATILYALGVIPATSRWSAWFFSGERSTFIAGYLLASVLALYAVSTLGSRLSRGLKQVEHLQEEIIENMEEGLLAVDDRGRIVHLNGEARKFLELPGTAASYRGCSLSEVLAHLDRHPAGGPACRRLEDGFSGRSRSRFELELTGAGGEERHIEVRLSSVLDERGRLRCRIGLFSDLSLEREIEVAERRIEQLEELRVMAMGIAHEIRNPLASIRGCVQEISRLAAGNAPQQAFAAIVMRESDRLDRIIEDSQRFARKAPLQLGPLDLVEVLEGAAALLRSRDDFGARELVWCPPAHPVWIRGDRDRLLQVFLNLGLNAIEATPRDGGRLGIELRQGAFPGLRLAPEDRRREGVEVILWDEGDGIAEEDIARAFAPFFTTKNTGSGLGLSIVERIIREHGGTVELDSRRGRGTVVRVRLPAAAKGWPAASGGATDGGEVERKEVVEVMCHA